MYGGDVIKLTLWIYEEVVEIEGDSTNSLN